MSAMCKPRSGTTVVVELSNARVYAVRVDAALKSETEWQANRVYEPYNNFVVALRKLTEIAE